jgi:hypothetical protein
LGAGWKSHIASRDRRAVSEELAAAVAEERDFFMVWDIENHAERRSFNVEITASPVRKDGKEVVGDVCRITLVNQL